MILAFCLHGYDDRHRFFPKFAPLDNLHRAMQDSHWLTKDVLQACLLQVILLCRFLLFLICFSDAMLLPYFNRTTVQSKRPAFAFRV
jgi:hypothetical protein